MHQRAVLCSMCGGKFFPASLAFHQKACARKQNFLMLPCPYCDVEIPKPELSTHVSQACKKAPEKAAAATDRSAAHRSSLTSSSKVASVSSPGSDLIDETGRMRCPVCKRWFNQDRIGKHQAICRKVSEKQKNKKQYIFDSFQQRKFDHLIKRADAEETEAKGSMPAAGDAGALRAARSYYTSRPLRRAEERHKPSPSAREAIPKASKKPQAQQKNAGVTSGNRRTSGAIASGAPNSVASDSTAATRGRGTACKRNVSQPSSAQNRLTVSVQQHQQQHRGGRSLPPRTGDVQKAWCRHLGRSCIGGGGGGAILESNEASIDNTLAYPNYPVNWERSKTNQESAFISSPGAASMGPSPSENVLHALGVRGRGTPTGKTGNLGILTTNEASADNPLAFPYR